MAVLIQPFVAARASGGGLSETAEGNMLVSATWGLGSAIAQGEVVPDRVVLSRQGFVRPSKPAARITAIPAVIGQVGPAGRAEGGAAEPCLTPGAGDRTRPTCCASAKTLLGLPVEIEWAVDEDRFKTAAGAAAAYAGAAGAGRIWLTHPRARRPSRRYRLGRGPRRGGQLRVRAARVAPGDVWLPASQVRRSATSCRGRRRRGRAAAADLASCFARSRARHSDGARRADATAAFPMAPRSRSTASPASCGGSHEPRRSIFVTQPIAESATKRLRALGSVKVFPTTAGSCRNRS